VLHILAPAGQLSIMAAMLVGLVIALTLLRRALLRKNAPQPVAAVPTWGCGYAAPTPRMQYSASSFAWSLVYSFRHLLWSERVVEMPGGVFPGHARLESHTPDMAHHDFFEPLFGLLARIFQMVRTVSWSGEPAAAAHDTPAVGRVNPLRLLLSGVTTGLRRGSIHVHLTFIVLALLVVFLVEAVASSSSPSPSNPPTERQTKGVAP
jgi:hypothetical protein